LGGSDRAALDLLAPRVYKELRRVAGNLTQVEQGGRTLTATALVHEAYLRLVDVSRIEVEHRAHFLAWAGEGNAPDPARQGTPPRIGRCPPGAKVFFQSVTVFVSELRNRDEGSCE
jgi:hypothetical protein